MNFSRLQSSESSDAASDLKRRAGGAFPARTHPRAAARGDDDVEAVRHRASGADVRLGAPRARGVRARVARDPARRLVRREDNHAVVARVVARGPSPGGHPRGPSPTPERCRPLPPRRRDRRGRPPPRRGLVRPRLVRGRRPRRRHLLPMRRRGARHRHLPRPQRVPLDRRVLPRARQRHRHRAHAIRHPPRGGPRVPHRRRRRRSRAPRVRASRPRRRPCSPTTG